MMKKCILFLLVVVISLNLGVAFASLEPDHDKCLNLVLFGNEKVSFVNQHQKDALQALDKAVALSIDQFGLDDAPFNTKIDILVRFGVSKSQLPENVKEINPGTSGISSGQHRSYTHRGWDFVYLPDNANWNARKTILLATVDKVFEFHSSSGLFSDNVKYTKQCDSFSALLYYVHILQDYVHDFENEFSESSQGKKNELKVEFARVNANENNIDLFYEIKKHCEVLFGNQGSSRYDTFVRQLDQLASKARWYQNDTNGRYDSEEKYNKEKQYIMCLKELLQYNIPELLKNEDFFTKVFS